jgi:hypothetical protein
MLVYRIKFKAQQNVSTGLDNKLKTQQNGFVRKRINLKPN